MDKRKLGWLMAIAGAVVASVWYRVTVFERLEQTSALFIGISGVFLGEGLICILMAAPLFYLVAILIGVARDRADKRSTIVSCALILTMVPISSEGTRPGLSFGREET